MKKLCKTCELIQQRDAGVAPLWDCIYRTEFWDVVHSYNSALPGWLVLVARRHIEAIDELMENEAAELGILMQQVSAALKEVTGCIKTYVLQFAEHPDHPHVHFHIVPRMANQPQNRCSAQVLGYLGIPEEERVSDEAMNTIAARIQRILASNSSI
ncbi:MAG: HIT family protein [Chloroflexi bacterium]|nr:HIT family protein [Chloroflexota bacterium]